MPSHKRWGKVITMPVPQGQITSSNIWTGEPLSEGEKNYKVTFLSRRETVITANSKEDALVRAKFRVSKDENDYNSFFQDFEEKVEEL
jgi:hypothetical protein